MCAKGDSNPASVDPVTNVTELTRASQGGKSWEWDGNLRRRNTFITTVATGRDYDVAFFSTNPQSLHYQLPNQDESTRVRIGCFYSNPQRLVVMWKGTYKRDLNPSGYDFTNVIRPTASHPCGSNTYVRTGSSKQ